MLETESVTRRIINRRYRLERQLGCGGMGTVFLAQDTLQDDLPVALKCVFATGSSENATRSLRNEFLAQAGLRHPGLARVWDFGIDEGTGDSFFTTEFIDGSDLLTATSSFNLSTVEGSAALLEVVVQILRSLAFIHAHGLIHGDLKPANILVAGCKDGGGSASSEGFQAKLIDFGITTREHEFTGKKVLGTKSYIAPETIIGSHLDRRMDLYSFGAVLYHLVTGQPPFGGRSNLAVLRDHVESVPKPPSAVRAGIPDYLDVVILRLLEKRPADRYQNALEVIEDLNQHTGTSLPLETRETTAGYLQSDPVADRQGELWLLYQALCSSCGLSLNEQDEGAQMLLGGEQDSEGLAFEAVQVPQAHTALLRGEKGAGKERLASRLCHLAQIRGAGFLRVECSTEVGDDPSAPDAAALSAPQRDFQQLLNGFRALSLWRDSPPAAFTRAESLVSVGASGEETPKILEILDELATRFRDVTRDRPVLLHVSHSGEATLLLDAFLRALIRQVADGDDVGPSNLFIVVTLPGGGEERNLAFFESLETESVRPLALHLTLDRLEFAGVQQLLDSKMPRNEFGDDFLRHVFEASDGNPRAVTEICQFLANGRHIERTTSGWRAVEGVESLALPTSLRRDLEEKIAALDRDTLHLAIAFSVLGKAAEYDLALKLSRLEASVGPVCLEKLVACGLLQKVRGGGGASNTLGLEYAFVQASAREIIFARVSEKQRKHLHYLAGMVYLRHHGAEDPEACKQLAYQFLRSGNKPHGFPYGLQAARAYTNALELRRALETYQRIIALCEDGDDATLREAHHRAAKVQLRLGNFEEAARLLSALATQANEDDLECFEMFVAIARAYGRLGLFLMSESFLEKAERCGIRARVKAGSASWGAERRCLAELRFLQGRFRESLSSCEEAIEKCQDCGDVRLLASCYLLAAEASFLLGDAKAAASHCQAALRKVDGRSDPDLVDLAVYCLGKLNKYAARFTLARKQFQACAAKRRKLGLTDDLAEVLVEIGGVELFLERPGEALRHLEQGSKAYRKTKNAIGVLKCQNLIAEALRQLGRFDESSRLLKDAEGRQRRVGGATKSQWESALVEGRIHLDQGDLRAAARNLQRASKALPEDPRSKLKLYHYRCQLEYQRGSYADVLKFTHAGLGAVKEMGNELRRAAFLELRASAFVRLGQFDAARAVVKDLVAAARKWKLPVKEARGYLIEARATLHEGRWEPAEELLQRAAKIFSAEKSEPDLAALYLQYSVLHMKVAEYEPCFLELEEALYLAKKLNLSFLKPQVFSALGRFEAKISEGNREKADQYMAHAERLAKEAGYVDLHWEIVYYRACILRARGANDEAENLFRTAFNGRNRILQGLTPEAQQIFLKESVGTELARFQPQQA